MTDRSLTKQQKLHERLRAVYERLWVDCEPITLQDAQTILESSMELKEHRCHHALDVALNTGDGSYRP